MKNTIFSILFLFVAFFAIGQKDAVTYVQTIEKSGNTYYLKTVTTFDYGLPFQNQTTTFEEIGDSLAVLARFVRLIEDERTQVQTAISRAFDLPQVQQSFNEINQAVQTFTGGTNLQELLNDAFSTHYGVSNNGAIVGKYRIVIPGETSETYARLLRLPGGGIRLRLIQGENGPDVSPTVQYVVNLRSSRDFQITYPAGGTVYSCWLDDGRTNIRKPIFRPLQVLIPGTTLAFSRIIKLK